MQTGYRCNRKNAYIIHTLYIYSGINHHLKIGHRRNDLKQKCSFSPFFCREFCITIMKSMELLSNWV